MFSLSKNQSVLWSTVELGEMRFIDVVTKARKGGNLLPVTHKIFVKLHVCNHARMTVCQSLWLVMAYNDI